MFGMCVAKPDTCMGDSGERKHLTISELTLPFKAVTLRGLGFCSNTAGISQNTLTLCRAGLSEPTSSAMQETGSCYISPHTLESLIDFTDCLVLLMKPYPFVLEYFCMKNKTKSSLKSTQPVTNEWKPLPLGGGCKTGRRVLEAIELMG